MPGFAASAMAGRVFIDDMFGISITRDIQYGSNVNGAGESLPLMLDIYQPTGPNLPTELPAIVVMHGGYFWSGNKQQIDAVELSRMFASRGYVAVSINYRLLGELAPAPGDPISYSPDRLPAWLLPELVSAGLTIEQYTSTIAAAVEDQAMAVNWLSQNAASFNINPRMIAAGGFSAGAVSSLALGTGIVDGVQADIGAVLSLAGGLFGSEASIDSGAAPAYFVHGTLDSIVPFVENSFLVDAYQTAGVPYISNVRSNVGHSFYGLATPLVTDPAVFSFMIDNLRAHAVPEPGSVVLLGCGLVGLVSWKLRRRRQGS
jgi:para-nitrobenzyl esterase